MKTKVTFLMVLFVMSITACKKTSDPEVFVPAELEIVFKSLTASFDSLNVDISTNATDIALNISDSMLIRSKLAGLYNRSTFATVFAFVTPEGIMQMTEPPVYYPDQGADISSQDHVIKAFQTKLPVLSKTFFAVEGFYAAVDIHPIVNGEQVFGAITSLFLPEEILGRIIEPLTENQAFDIMVMEKGGNTLYDADSMEIGRNVFTDPLYEPFPELIAAAEKVDAEKSGETSYSFFETGTSNKVVKKAYWTTYELYGVEWKIVYMKTE
jgi:hypothetical protein